LVVLDDELVVFDDELLPLAEPDDLVSLAEPDDLVPVAEPDGLDPPVTPAPPLPLARAGALATPIAAANATAAEQTMRRSLECDNSQPLSFVCLRG